MVIGQCPGRDLALGKPYTHAHINALVCTHTLSLSHIHTPKYKHTLERRENARLHTCPYTHAPSTHSQTFKATRYPKAQITQQQLHGRITHIFARTPNLLRYLRVLQGTLLINLSPIGRPQVSGLIKWCYIKFTIGEFKMYLFNGKIGAGRGGAQEGVC